METLDAKCQEKHQRCCELKCIVAKTLQWVGLMVSRSILICKYHTHDRVSLLGFTFENSKIKFKRITLNCLTQTLLFWKQQ